MKTASQPARRASWARGFAVHRQPRHPGMARVASYALHGCLGYGFSLTNPYLDPEDLLTYFETHSSNLGVPSHNAAKNLLDLVCSIKEMFGMFYTRTLGLTSTPSLHASVLQLLEIARALKLLFCVPRTSHSTKTVIHDRGPAERSPCL